MLRVIGPIVLFLLAVALFGNGLVIPAMLAGLVAVVLAAFLAASLIVFEMPDSPAPPGPERMEYFRSVLTLADDDERNNPKV